MNILLITRAMLVSMALSLTCALFTGCGAGSVESLAGGTVSRAQNPLVAIYTIEAGCQGQVMVEFGPTTAYGRSTAWYPTPQSAFQPTSILVAGMKPSTTYHMRSDVQCGNSTSNSGDTTFTTGALPSLDFPTLTVTRPNPSLRSSENPGIEMMDIAVDDVPAFFTDRDGNVIWYYSVPGYSLSTMKFLSNGHLITSWANAALNSTDSFLREIDLSGNIIRSLDIAALATQLQKGGFDFAPISFHHDVLPLPNGHLIVLVNSTKAFTNLPGYPGTVQVLGDQVVDLDQNWNVAWAWNSFDYDGNGMDINRHLNGLPDWTHSNALVYSPDDGNILLSMRHQSWILKLNYSNGAGDGSILWHLGYEGDFALDVAGVVTDDPGEWFSFQHFPSLVSQNGSLTTLAVWDNGDFRLNNAGMACGLAGGGQIIPCYSRATIFQVDEGSLVANLAWNDQQQLYGLWGGSINQLANGNVEFDLNSPATPPSPNVASRVQEVTQTSSPQVIWQMDVSPSTSNAYRAYRVPSLYPGVTWQF